MEGANITVAIAFIAGVASFLSPCVLPLVPGYVSLISGVSIERLKSSDGSKSAARRAVIANSLAFNAGLSLIFVSLGAAAGWIGASVISNPWVRIIGGVIIIIFGLQLIGSLKIGALYKDTRFFSQQKSRGVLGSFTLGVAFAAGWTPCIGPILGAIIGLAAISGGWKSGLILSGFYAAGLAVPFLITGLGINQFLSFYARFRRHLHKVEVASGVVLIFIGVLVASGYATLLNSSRLASLVPNLEAKIRVAPASSAVKPATSTETSTAGNSFARAPDIAMQTLSGEPFQLSELRGRVVLVNFWATWCVPCLSEIPDLSAIQRDLGSQGLRVVGISWDDSAEGVREFQSDIKQDYLVVLGGEDVQARFGGVPSLPTTLVIDREGRIRQKIIGARDRAGLEAAVKPFLE
ncbi:MAG TPA: cytochrome c biogenesis protein CcdA [Pyrinomonadaceae bacterium]|jgi:cytochrome c-type biogenesis protein|nr:cytochrome c biogenesis protein CcdA [Pyrinomonadaceae bacterium]